MRAWLLPRPHRDRLHDPLRSPRPHRPRPRRHPPLKPTSPLSTPPTTTLALNQYPAKPTFPHILGRDGIGTVLAPRQKRHHHHQTRRHETHPPLRSRRLPPRYPRQRCLRRKQDTPSPSPKAGPRNRAAAAPPRLHHHAASPHPIQQQPTPRPRHHRPHHRRATGGVGVAAAQLAHAMEHTPSSGLSRSGKEKSATLRTLTAPTTPQPRREKILAQKQLTAELGDNGKPIPPRHRQYRRPPLPRKSSKPSPCTANAPSSADSPPAPSPTSTPPPSSSAASKSAASPSASYTHEETLDAWKNVLATLHKTNAHPVIDHIYKMEEVPAAFARLHDGPMGKVLIRIT